MRERKRTRSDETRDAWGKGRRERRTEPDPKIELIESPDEVGEGSASAVLLVVLDPEISSDICSLLDEFLRVF